ncbi:MAG TPA: class II aldolase/adducin family protein [Acidimicrobiales bacterium]|nr:class II aldolase/adducin family protein [Acidimicrobiales bacterium]
MKNLRDIAIEELVIANRILGHEGILDAYGHISVRNPDNPSQYLLSRARSPEVIEAGDICNYSHDGTPADSSDSIPYIERYIHGAIYEVRPDITAICHNHTLSILPFGISKNVALKAVIHTARFLGTSAPVWDIAEEFGSDTDLLVRNMAQGRSLARSMGKGSIALMRGHGSVVASNDMASLVTMCIGMDRNAKVQREAMMFGEYRSLEEGEISASAIPAQKGRGDNRAWEYFQRRAGII